ncbi:MAG: hypothetical protein IKY42_01975 [Bacteroidaceae bacterium]|nr:hypothetical protein [Bacteroidaceae bacterium]
MRKTITTLLFLILMVGLSAETGYAGNQWGDNKSSFDLKVESINTLSKKKVMLGKETTLYYYFSDDYLCGVSYTLPIEKTAELKAKYRNLIREEELVGISNEEWTASMKRKNVDDSQNDLYANNFIFTIAVSLSTNGFPNTPAKKGKSKLYAYNYNDDTWALIFENYLEGQTHVVYIYHEQDY